MDPVYHSAIMKRPQAFARRRRAGAAHPGGFKTFSKRPSIRPFQKQTGQGPATQFPAHMKHHLTQLIFVNKTFSVLPASTSYFNGLKAPTPSSNLPTSSLRVASAKGRRAVAARLGPCFFFMKAKVDGAPFLIHFSTTSLPFVSTAGREAVPSGTAPAFFRGTFPSPFRKREYRP